MGSYLAKRLFVVFGITLLVLAACSSKLTSSMLARQASSSQTTVTPNFTQTMAAIQLKSTKEYLSEDPEVLGYHAVLMVERAADLIVTYGTGLQSDQIHLSDASARRSYTEAFPVAVDTFNKTTPPSYMVNSWSNVSYALRQYEQAYEALIKGKPLAFIDLARLSSSRQWLTNYQKMAETNLKRRGLDAQFFAAKQEEVEKHFRDAYGNDPLPTTLP